jgi:hypothetical protein
MVAQSDIRLDGVRFSKPKVLRMGDVSSNSGA